jgi:hypothetical protein
MLLVPLRRVSTGEQVDGTGLQRQSDAFAAYAQQRGWDLHPRTYSDEGVSGFSGANLDGDLGRFLRDLKAGRFHRSDVALGVEDLDRLSRQFALTFLPILVDDLLNADVTISVISKGKDISRQSVRSNPMELHELLFWMNGAHEFSDKLSKRISAHRESLRAAIRSGKPANPGTAPSWINLKNGQWVLNSYADVVRQMIALSQSGLGSVAIAKKLNAEKVPTPAVRRGRRATAWASESVMQILKSPAIHGARRVAEPGFNARMREWKESIAHKQRQCVPESQWPAKPQRTYEPDQEGYYPALLSKAEHLLLIRQIAERKVAGPCVKEEPFTWLGQRLTRCSCGAAMSASSTRVKGVRYAYLRCTGAKAGARGCKQKMTSLLAAQAHVLTRLSRDDISSLTQDRAATADAIATAAAKAKDAASTIARLNKQLKAGEVALQEQDDPNVIAVLAKRQWQLQKDLNAATAAELDARQQLLDLRDTPSDRLLQEASEAVRELRRTFFRGEDSASDRRRINRLLHQLELTIVINGDSQQVGVQVGDGEIDWQPINTALDQAALQRGMSGSDRIPEELISA